jgi:hypothetical protein
MAPGKSTNNGPKTFAEFEKFRQELYSKDFQAKHLHPIEFGLERTRFEMERLAQLISVAEHVDGVTIKSRLEGWKRQLRRLQSAHERFQSLATQDTEFRKARLGSSTL